MTSDRLYRRRISIDAALQELKRHAGTQFDTTIVDAFCKQVTRHHSSGGEPQPNIVSA